MLLLLSELWFVVIVVAAAQVVRRGWSFWVGLAVALAVDVALAVALDVGRPWPLSVLNIVVLVVAVNAALGLTQVDVMVDVPDRPPTADPTFELLTLVAHLHGEGFEAVHDDSFLIGEPPMHLCVLLRADGTLAELVHRPGFPPGFAFRTELDPGAPGYRTIESVPWEGGWPADTARRVAVPGGTWRELLVAHDAALAEATAAGAQPVVIPREDAVANVLESDREAARRVAKRPWWMMLTAAPRRARRR